MARFVEIPKGKKPCFWVNVDHVQCVTYKEAAGRHYVTLGNTALPEGKLVIATAEFDSKEEADGFIHKNFILFNT